MLVLPNGSCLHAYCITEEKWQGNSPQRKKKRRKFSLNVLCYCHLDKIFPHKVSNLNVSYSNSKLAAVNFSCTVLRLIVKVKELSLIGNRVECLLMLDFEITNDNIVHSRSQANSTNIEFQFTLLCGAWDNQKEVFGAFWKISR